VCTERRAQAGRAGTSLSAGQRRLHFAILLAFVAVAALLELAACALLGPPVRDPSVVGVIVHKENINGIWHYMLEGGRTVEVDFDETTTLEGSRGGGEPGTLLLYGNSERAWYFGLTQIDPDRMPGCFWWPTQAVDDDTHIIFQNRIRLPKAADFDGMGWPRDGRYNRPAFAGGGFTSFCINEQGEVTVYLANE
jgi:hypothetical protein